MSNNRYVIYLPHTKEEIEVPEELVCSMEKKGLIERVISDDGELRLFLTDRGKQAADEGSS